MKEGKKSRIFSCFRFVCPDFCVYMRDLQELQEKKQDERKTRSSTTEAAAITDEHQNSVNFTDCAVIMWSGVCRPKKHINIECTQ